MWEQHCDKAVKEVGFVAVGPEWPSTYYHTEMELLLVVYVDDLKWPVQNPNEIGMAEATIKVRLRIRN